MDKIKLLQTRRSKVLEAGSEIRKTISELVDADSFVELSGYSFSKNEFYGEDAEGEGVVTGFATVEGYPVYVAAQNFKVMSGGVSKANCEKILKCLTLAEKIRRPSSIFSTASAFKSAKASPFWRGLPPFWLNPRVCTASCRNLRS